MKRRGFFATVAAVLAAPKAVKLLPVEAPVSPFFGIDRTFQPQGIAAWLPDDFVMNPFPMTVAGRLDWVADMHADGLVSDEQARRLQNAVSDPWEPDYDA